MSGDAKRADSHINLAIAFKHHNNITASIHHWKQAAKMRPKRADLAFSTGNALKEQGNAAEAATFYEMALKADPHNPKYMFALALVNRVRYCMHFYPPHAAQLLGQPDEETQALADKSLTSGKPIDHFELGVWMQDDQPTVALMHLKKFLETDPRHPNVRSAVYIMGRIYEECVSTTTSSFLSPHHRLGGRNQSEALYAAAVERGMWVDARQRPGILLRKLTPSAPFPWENITSLLAAPIALLESNYKAIKDELLSNVELDFEAPPKAVQLKTDNENVTGGVGTWKQVCAYIASAT